MRITRPIVVASIIAATIGANAISLHASPSAPAAAASPAEVSIPNTRRIEFVSKVNGHRYLLELALPVVAAPPQGYGVLYVLDGNGFFASATELCRLNARDVIVVGIGYPDDSAYVEKVLAQRGPIPKDFSRLPPRDIAYLLERQYDLSLPAGNEQLAQQTAPGQIPMKRENVGGMDDFLKTIETEVKPRVAAAAPVNTANQVLFGHSLGGLTALHALFTEPAAFRTYIIASPSIWWNHKAVLADEAGFVAAVTAGQANPRVLVTVGGEESTPPAMVPVSWGIDRASLATELRKARMVENGRELIARLKALQGRPGYLVADYAVFEQQNHTLAPWPAMARGVGFAFSGAP